MYYRVFVVANTPCFVVTKVRNLIVFLVIKSSFSAHIPQIWQHNGLKFAYCNILL